MAELSVGYPNGPLSRTEGAHHSGPAAGARVPLPVAGNPIGSGNRPLFALFAQPTPQAAALIARHPDLLEGEPRPPFEPGGMWLVRPDGYVAMAAGAQDWDKVDAYPDWIAGTAAEKQ